jgi:cytoskeletal protein CcmA (bactofilin family)
MHEGKHGDLTINGYGSSNGGHFQKVTLNGKGTVNSDVICESLESNGAGTVKGNVTANKRVKMSGSGKIMGSLTCDELTMEGRGSIKQDLTAKKVKISGKGTVGGKINTDEIKVQGRMTVGGDCEAETFKAEGDFQIDGLLNAESISIHLHGKTNVKEIGGQRIEVKSSRWIKLLKSMFPCELNTNLVEGDHVRLEGTKATTVRGSEVIIGKDCEINVVEYKDTLTVHHTAIVKERKKI